jgi:hypothetical protein
MSAWMVSKRHIDVMVTLAMVRQHGDLLTYWWGDLRHGVASADELGKILARENARSLEHRYGDGAEMVWWNIEAYRWQRVHLPQPGELFRGIACYEYQACEASDWPETEAHAIVEALTARVIERVPCPENAPWGWDESNTTPDRSVSLTDMPR